MAKKKFVKTKKETKPEVKTKTKVKPVLPKNKITASVEINKVVKTYKKAKALEAGFKKSKESAGEQIKLFIDKKTCLVDNKDIILATYEYDKSSSSTDWEALCFKLMKKLKYGESKKEKLAQKYTKIKKGKKRLSVK